MDDHRLLLLALDGLMGLRHKSRREVADAAGISYDTLGRWLRYEETPRLDGFVRVVYAAETNFAELELEAGRIPDRAKRVAGIADAPEGLAPGD